MGAKAGLTALWRRARSPHLREVVVVSLVVLVAAAAAMAGLLVSSGSNESQVRTRTGLGGAGPTTSPVTVTAGNVPVLTSPSTTVQMAVPTTTVDVNSAISSTTVTTKPVTTPSAPPSGPKWRQMASGVPPAPPDQGDVEMAYDPATTTDVLLDDGQTWTWDGSTWTQLHPVTSPPARVEGAMAFDSATGKIVLFGGGTTDARSYLGDTWTWDGTNWTQQTPAQSPPPEQSATLADDLSTNQLVLFGGENMSIPNPTFDYGYSNETWVWTGNTWQQQNPANSPPPRADGSIAYDPVTHDVVLFGGVCTCGGIYNDTWAWNGTDWTQQSPTSNPPASLSPKLIYDSALGAPLLIMSNVSTNSWQTWLWSGGSWTRQNPTNSPAYEAEVGAQDPVTGEPVVMDTNTGHSPPVQETWVYVKAPT